MSADIFKPKQELAPQLEGTRQELNWQALSKWGCLGSVAVIVLPALVCAGVAAWLMFTTPTTVVAPQRPLVAHRIPNCKQQGKQVYMHLGKNGEIIKYSCGG